MNDNAAMARILVLEPYPEIRDLLSHVIAGLGYEPVLHSGAREAPPDVDVLLLEPGYPSGLDIARELRRRSPQLPIVCLSIYPPTPEVAALDPVAYIVKPFALTTLQRALEDAVARAEVSEGRSEG